jgi:hypothetical protein
MSYISHVDYKNMMENFKKGAPKQMLKESLDPVGKEDDDINNDGKVNKTDKYLASRRQAIGQAIGKGRAMKESDLENDKWYEDFEDGLRNLANNKYISPLELRHYMKALDHVDPMDNYSEMNGHDAAKEFVDDLRSKENMQESGTGDEPFDFNKSSIESATGDKISHTETDDYGEAVYWSTKNPNVTYQINDNDQIIKYDSETGERYPIGNLKHYDEPIDDYEPDTDADYEEPRDDFDMAGDFNDGEFWENEIKKLQEKAGIRESHPANDQWYDAFKDVLANSKMSDKGKQQVAQALDNTDVVGKYGDMEPEEAFKKFVWDLIHKVSGIKETELEFADDDTEDPQAAKEKRAKKMEMDDEEAENAEREEEGLNEGANYEDPYTLAKAVAQAHPELQRFALEDRTMFQRAAFKYASELMKAGGVSNTAQINLINGYADEDWPSDYISALGQELEGMEEGLHMPPLQATGPTVDTNEGMHMPPLQATGNSAVKEDQAPFGMSVLSPDERKQLREYINSYRTIKSEISKLLSKTGKTGEIMENAKKAEDETVPAERKAKYKDPTTVPTQHKHSNLGGDRTNLVMTKAEMWENEEHEESEHERIESMLDTKLHDAFHKVTGMIMKDLMADGFDEGDIKNFLQHEIDEKAKEAINAQHDF